MASRMNSVKELKFTPQDDVFPSQSDRPDVLIHFLLADQFDNNQEGVLTPMFLVGPLPAGTRNKGESFRVET